MKRLILSALCVLTFSVQADAVNTNANEQLSDAYVRSAISFMTFSQTLETDEPAMLAGTLLDAAVQLNPGNALAWSMRAELAESQGDQEAYEDALVGYLDTGIDDDRARFNLIRYRLASNNTLDGQLRDVEKLLNSDAGRALSGPLRSRLASFATAVASELLDERARRKWAVEAARADPANLDAAQTMLGLVVELGGDAVRRGTATVNVVRAGPLASGARLELAALLAEHGAFERAAQQYQVVSTRLSAQPLHLSDYTNWAHCLAMTGQDEMLLQLLDEFEKALNQTSVQPAEEGADADQAEEPEAEPVDLPLSLGLIRLAVLRDAEDQDRAQLVFDRIVRQLNEAPREGDDPNLVEQAKENLSLIAAVFGPNLDQAEQIVKDNGDDAVALGWLAMRRGDADKARGLLQPHANQKPLAACGLALATGQDAAGRARLLQSYIESASTSSLAALAAGRAMLQIETPAQPNTTGKALLALMSKYPESFWLVDIERTPWIDVRLKVKPQRIKPLQPVRAEITVWNTSRFPLAISETGPINQSAVVTLNASNSGRQIPPTPPIVIDIGRRLSLKAGERMIVDARLDYHQFGSLRGENPGVPFSFDARLLINPTLTPFGSWRPNGIGSVSDVRDSLIEARPASEQLVETWSDEIASDEASTRLHAMQRLAALDRESQPDLVGPALVQRVNTKLLEVWGEATEVEQAWMILNTIELDKAETTFPDLLKRATESKSKFVWLALLTSQAIEQDSELFRTAIGRQDLPEVASFAERQRRLLRDFATFREEQQADQPAE